jgi:hypothetical protein
MDHLRGNDVRLQISLLHEEHFDSLQQDTFVRCSPTFRVSKAICSRKFESGFQLESVRESARWSQ